ncbi:SRPBCC domain-containing protein [Lutibacter sp.]|uniref:SRPBCC family protein n=1 Tax=Lutibacter sp. TaxID=1925666 RepID=UPI0035694F1C
MTSKETPIIVEQSFEASVNIIWNAITNIHEMKCWFFDSIPNFIPVVGFKTEFNVTSEERNFKHLWTVTEVEPLKKIITNWKYEEYSGNSFVHFELLEQTNGTMLRITSIVTESFPTNIPEFKPESCRAGWKYFMNRLKNYIETNS